jgi:hypothetical protein
MDLTTITFLCGEKEKGNYVSVVEKCDVDAAEVVIWRKERYRHRLTEHRVFL